MLELAFCVKTIEIFFCPPEFKAFKVQAAQLDSAQLKMAAKTSLDVEFPRKVGFRQKSFFSGDF